MPYFDVSSLTVRSGGTWTLSLRISGVVSIDGSSAHEGDWNVGDEGWIAAVGGDEKRQE